MFAEQMRLKSAKTANPAGRMDAAKLAGQKTGQFCLIREREIVPIQTEPSLIPTAQVPEDRILELARAAR